MIRPSKYTLLALACTLSACSGIGSKFEISSSEQQNRDFLPGVKIVYSANIDGEISPCGCRSNPTGGIDRRYDLMKQKVSGETLQLDSGDLLYQSNPVPPFLEKQWTYQASTLVAAYKKLGVEFFTPGELDYGAGRETLEKLLKKASFRTLSANLIDSTTQKSVFEEYAVIVKGKKKIGVFGLTGTEIGLAPQTMGLTVLEPITTATKMVSILKGRADVIIAITHQGVDKDRELAQKVSGIDAIFGAHSQSFLHRPEKVNDTLIFQPSFRGQHIGVYAAGENAMYQIDARFDSPADQQNEMDMLVANAKKEIARLNKESDDELFGTKSTPTPPKTTKVLKRNYQTITNCVECHKPQYDFHLPSRHQSAFKTLVSKGEDFNVDCLQCHTVGAGKPGGWSNVNRLVVASNGQAINSKNFAERLAQNPHQNFTKIRRAYINVQCESCHGPAGNHPKEPVSFAKVSVNTCTQCHTQERAPNWYKKDGALDRDLAEKKLQSLTCPR